MINLCKRREKEWPFIKHSFKIDFSINSLNKIVFQYNNFFNQQIDYVITPEKEFRLGIGHLKISDKSDFLIGAGRIIVNNYGYIIYIDNKSGHYRPKIENLKLSIDTLISQSINLDYCKGVVLDNAMNIINYIDQTKKIFEPSHNDIDLTIDRTYLDIEIPKNFDWLVYKTKNNLEFLNTEYECQEHYRQTGYILGHKIAKNPNYHEIQ